MRQATNARSTTRLGLLAGLALTALLGPGCGTSGSIDTSCDDAVRNGDETDIDCGGSCAPCPDGAGCAVAGDCASGLCAEGTCRAEQTPSCDDGERNGGETDVDCGGSCPPCADGAGCAEDSDCRSGFCDAGSCTASQDDLCPDDPDKTAPGQCGCGTADVDGDGDGSPDCNDGCPADPDKTAPGQCGCGTADDDSDGDGSADCDDGCPADPDKTAPGQCGCGTADDDGDGDGSPDCNDGCPADPDKTAPGGCGCGVPEQPGCAADRVIDHSDTDLAAIPADAIDTAQQQLHIAYQHTSHGSQLITGMNALEAFPDFGDRYAWDDSGQTAGALDLDDYGIPGCADLSQGDWVDDNGDTPWVVATRELLDNPDNEHINAVVWSWCSIDGHDAQRYVDNMEKLVAEYPQVIFVFMTGHAQGQGEDMTEDSVHYNNQLIRQHCADHHRWLFDFADIEAYDPDGNYYWDQNMWDNLDYDGGNWALEWCAANPDAELTRLTTGAGVDGYDGCQGCAHSSSPQQANLNCVLKGRAAWHLWARLAGWGG